MTATKASQKLLNGDTIISETGALADVLSTSAVADLVAGVESKVEAGTSLSEVTALSLV